ncbi:MAG: tetraacyldisaccharide 4'-kinase [Gemmatimonadota bacterium]
MRFEPSGPGAAARAWLEARIRATWSGRPAQGLLLASSAFALAHDLRDFLFEAGIAKSRQPPIPVLSVGGLTAGGSGKTPIAAEVSRWLDEAGWRASLVTAGLADEMRALALLAPHAMVEGGSDRLAAVRRAARSGAEIAVLDSGFQHRALRRVLDLVCVDLRGWNLPGRRRLPAGPFRERSGALARADAVVVVVRGDPDRAVAAGVEDSVRRFAVGGPVAVCRLMPVGFQPGNALAGSAPPGPLSVAAAGVMWPDDLFAAVRALGLTPSVELAFRDHEPFAPDRLARLLDAAREGGVVCSLKDAVKLGPLLADRVPVWYVEERPRWQLGGEVLRRGVLRIAQTVTGRPATGGLSGRRS